MGKVLIAAFDDKDEIAFDELLLFLKSNSHIKVVNAFPNDSCLKYDNLIIDSKYRMVEADGKSICIFRKNCASVPEERSAIPLQTEQSSAG